MSFEADLPRGMVPHIYISLIVLSCRGCKMAHRVGIFILFDSFGISLFMMG